MEWCLKHFKMFKIVFQKVQLSTSQSNPVDYNDKALCKTENVLTYGLRKETSILDCV